MLEDGPVSEQIYKGYLPGRFAGYTVEKYFAERFTYLSEAEWSVMIGDGRVLINGLKACSQQVLRLHDHITTNMGFHKEPPADRSLKILYEDAHLRVFNKGAPLPVHPSGRYFKNSLTEILRLKYPEETPRPVQRLDAITTGVQVFAKRQSVASALMKAFSENRVKKEYLALVEGIPGEKSFVVDHPVGKIKGSKRGIGSEAQGLKSASTVFHWIHTFGRRSLLWAHPRTGRTNQIRVHLAAIGLPLVNDPVYGKAEVGEGHGLHAYRLRIPLPHLSYCFKAQAPEHFHPYLWEQALLRENL